MKIGILGGSFDPIHKGHLTLARESQRQFHLEKVLFLPSLIPPHKRSDPHLAPAPYRARMVELAILGEPTWELCGLELRRQEVSYTVDTLRELRQIYPAPHRLFFIAGADSLCDLPRWKDPEKILKLSEWIVAPRPGFPLSSELPRGVHRLDIVPMPISATELRNKIEGGEDISEWIPQEVRDYMQKANVYRRKVL